jgi:hypothetical protein
MSKSHETEVENRQTSVVQDHPNETVTSQAAPLPGFSHPGAKEGSGTKFGHKEIMGS